MIKRVGRSLLAGLCRIPAPGRYAAVEWLAPLVMPAGPLDTTVQDGLRLRCDLRDRIQRQIYFGLYEPAETRFLLSLLRTGDTVLDVGANIGYYTLLMAKRVGRSGHVHAFEPIEDNVTILRQNIALNHLDTISVNQVAVTDGSTDMITLYLRGGAANTGWASIATSVRYENIPVRVPAVTIDDYVASRGLGDIAVIKLDIEGAEPLALRGAARTLARPEAPDIICEVNPFLLRRAGSSPTELLGLLTSLGYTVYEITSSGALRPYRGHDTQRLVNVFARKA